MVWHSAQCSGTTTPIIAENAPLDAPHPFRLERLCLESSRPTVPHTPDAPGVLFVHSGTAHVGWDGGEVELGSGDTMTVPIGVERTLSGSSEAIVYRVSGLMSFS